MGDGDRDGSGEHRYSGVLCGGDGERKGNWGGEDRMGPDGLPGVPGSHGRIIDKILPGLNFFRFFSLLLIEAYRGDCVDGILKRTEDGHAGMLQSPERREESL